MFHGGLRFGSSQLAITNRGALSFSPAIPAGAWNEQTSRLVFRLGYVEICRVHFRALTLDAHFTAMTMAAPDDLRADALAPGFDAFHIRCQPLERPLPCLSVLPHAIRYVRVQYERCFVDLSGNFADYLNAACSGKTRQTLRRKLRKFAEASGGAIDFREYTTPAELEIFYGVARAVSRKTYQEKLGVGLPDTGHFRSHMLELAERNSVRGYVLFVSGQPAAYLYTPADNGILLYDRLGHDPAFGELCPGTVLQYLVLQRLFEERLFRMFDFGPGVGTEHKQLFAGGKVLCAEIFYFRPTSTNWFMAASHRALTRGWETLVRTLEAADLKYPVRRFLRKHL